MFGMFDPLAAVEPRKHVCLCVFQTKSAVVFVQSSAEGVDFCGFQSEGFFLFFLLSKVQGKKNNNTSQSESQRNIFALVGKHFLVSSVTPKTAAVA